MINIWSRQRSNYKKYIDTLVPIELEQKLDAIVTACPIQTNELGAVQIFKASAGDQDTKELLSRWRFKNNSTGWNEIAPVTAPLVYFCFRPLNIEYTDAMHSGIIGGAMMAETLNAGYDFSFIGCTESVTESQLNLINNHLQEKYGINHRVDAPFLAFCIGIGFEKEDQPQTYTFEDGKTVSYLTAINRQQKPQLLFKPSLST